MIPGPIRRLTIHWRRTEMLADQQIRRPSQRRRGHVAAAGRMVAPRPRPHAGGAQCNASTAAESLDNTDKSSAAMTLPVNAQQCDGAVLFDQRHTGSVDLDAAGDLLLARSHKRRLWNIADRTAVGPRSSLAF
jgi:hypothetical protein